MSSDSPLDPIWKAFQTTSDCFKVARRAVSDGNLKLLDGTDFLGSPGFETDWIERSRQISEDLAIVSLWATFERFLIEYIQGKAVGLRDAKPHELAVSFYTKVEEEIENWRLAEILDLFKGYLDSNLIGQAKQIKAHRDWIAHKNPRRQPPAKIEANRAHIVLSQIIEGILLAETAS